MVAAQASAPQRVATLRRPESFVASLRAPALQAGEFRLHLRPLLPTDMVAADAGCATGFVLPKRLCKSAVRRNLIRRILRCRLQSWWLQAQPSLTAAQPLALVFRLTQKLPPEFVSARSDRLAVLLRERADQLIGRLERRLGPPA